MKIGADIEEDDETQSLDQSRESLYNRSPKKLAIQSLYTYSERSYSEPDIKMLNEVSEGKRVSKMIENKPLPMKY
jgi:hypothetical protein